MWLFIIYGVLCFVAIGLIAKVLNTIIDWAIEVVDGIKAIRDEIKKMNEGDK